MTIVYNMIYECKEVEMLVGLDALRIFRARGNIEMRKKYPIIYRDDIDKKCDYNPNDDYLYFLSSGDANNAESEESPWHCFTLIPDAGNYYKWIPSRSQHYYIKLPLKVDPLNLPWKRPLYSTLYLLNFLNWAIYYYNILTDEYSSIPKDPKQQEISYANYWTNFFADLIEGLSGKKYTEAERKENTKNAFKRNKFVLKPSLFLKLCRFFARAWYEERFSNPNYATGSVKFAYYVSNYIMSNPTQTKSPPCEDYDGNNDNHKKEVSRLFGNTKKLSYQFRGFDIKIEQFDNSDTNKNEKATYAISIIQYGCKSDFYLLARLYQYRYNTPIK